MAPAPATKKRANPRKRNRKRKRRNVSSSSSSSSEISSSSSSESENDEREREPTTVKLPQKRPSAVTKPVAVNATTTAKAVDDSSSSGSDVALDSDAGSDSEPESRPDASFPSLFSSPAKEAASVTQERDGETSRVTHKPRSPSPRNVPEPSILDGDKEKEEALRARFRQFWLGCVADAFADDLNEIRKEPNLTPARLSLLIDSLAAGANVYSSSSGPAPDSASEGNRQQVNEMEVVLGE
ncbi:hypothetical protein A7U60_g7964 [Sanghuangporus baumii]|uniref:Ribosome assembly protein 3 n=1 Tax=Sanghuangporus baumii TaxID=108892 RepID=A0A9Q5MZB6_SANBA|nr:hypothetical protein A7U60_g7964 [Sanghuangporus baumii]